MPATQRVIYIAGSGRSGTTLLERMLALVPGYVAAGELENIWTRGFEANQLCSCGQPFLSCEFWSDVTRAAFGDHARAPSEDLARIERARNRIRSIPAARLPAARTRSFQRDLLSYQTSLRQLHGAILSVSGADVIIDSSKSPSYGFLLATLQELDLSVVHLVRDSRAVAYSWQKLVRRPEVRTKTEYMGGFSPRTTAGRWNVKNILSEALRGSASSYIRIRYEDLVAEPIATLAVILESVGWRLERGFPLTNSDTVALPPLYHTVSGNPIRLDRGELHIRPDIEWTRALDRRSKAVVTGITAPLLVRYRYPLFSTPPPQEAEA